MPPEADKGYNRNLAKHERVQFSRDVLLVRANMDDTMRKVALKELRTIAEVSEVTVTKRILLVRPRVTTKPHQVERIIETLKQDYDDVQVETS
jgi:trehalose-6-phosphatase